ncbi:MAG: GNAT family N-acetyltransferase [Candidatus Bathyarchaeia archaeon]
MIRRCLESDFEATYIIVNEAAQAYRGVIPTDCWREPYMARDELRNEIRDGVVFWGYEENSDLLGVMGIQDVKDVSLIRHAYVRPNNQNRGVGNKLLSHLRSLTSRPTLVGTWKDATWAVRFYTNHGFKLVSKETKDRLLREYWSISNRQIETSVVLTDDRWAKQHR